MNQLDRASGPALVPDFTGFSEPASGWAEGSAATALEQPAWNWMKSTEQVWPDAPSSVEETGISGAFLEDLLCKTLHYRGPLSAESLCTFSGLSFEIIDELILQLKIDKFIEITNATHFGEMSYKYRLTDKGEARSMDAIARSGYASVAPVSLAQYTEVVSKQSLRQMPPSPGRIQAALSGFVLKENVRDNISRALHSGRASLIFGSSGNGKTAIIEAYARHADDTVIIPYALSVHGQLIRIFDATMHTPVEAEDEPFRHDAGMLKNGGLTGRLDQRWVKIRRPVVVVGGELTQESLELSFDPISRFYQAPPHMKAQDGVFVIDDFGRQRVRPEELLNRWILPMERGSDMMVLHSGESFTVPFEIALMFSTNLSPSDLVDEAFLRRIPYKVNLPSPAPDQFAEIARRVWTQKRISYTEESLAYLVRRLYDESFTFEPRAVYPRDIAMIVSDIARFDGVQPVMTPEFIERALEVYFIE